MSHKCFISFKEEDEDYKKYIQNNLDVDMIDKSLNEPIDSEDEDYIMRKIREDYLSDSTVTIFIIGERSSELLGWHEQRFIKRELQASLYNGSDNDRNGILGIVLPSMTDKIYLGSHTCDICGKIHETLDLNDDTVIREFGRNYFIPVNKCSWADEDRYCILTTWDSFVNSPNVYIDQAFDKRDEPIANKVRVRP